MSLLRALKLLPKPLAPGLAAILLLCACAGQAPAGREAEAEALRARVERLEREAASDRARLAADISAMREDMRALRLSLEEASRNLAAASGPSAPGASGPGQDGATKPAQPGQPGKSPRQALRDSLRSMLEVSREALERLNLELEKQLAQPPKPDKPGKQNL